ncbi:uncharacterized protein TNCV_3218471 [Trichonephila clavipes]|nr:uncharacterized protein TNCV_3218471 [Trichonephila clavipes]
MSNIQKSLIIIQVGEYNRKQHLPVGIIRIMILLRLSRERDEATIVAEALGPGGPYRLLMAAVAEWYRYRTVACFVTGSSPVPLKTRRVGQRGTLNLSRAETSSRWCGVVVRRGGCQLRCRPRHLTMVQNYVVRRQKPSCS